MTSRTGAPRCNGFTYLELIIVLVVLALTTAVILPRFNASMVGLNFTQTQAALLTDLRYAQARAILQRQPVQFALSDNTTPGYQLFVKTTPEPAEWQPIPGRFGRLRKLSRELSLAVRLPDGQTRQPPAVTFYPSGQADPAQLVVTSAAHQSATVLVDEATGQVSLAPHEAAP